ncbi:hypothetical protein [Agrobacterium bohemicum]|nr:hypothetical protein [Agrobacterium bohemicum]
MAVSEHHGSSKAVRAAIDKHLGVFSGNAVLVRRNIARQAQISKTYIDAEMSDSTGGFSVARHVTGDFRWPEFKTAGK